MAFLISFAFVDQSRPGYNDFNYSGTGSDTAREPKIVLEEITVQPMIVLSIRDTAASMNEIGPILGKCYGEISVFMRSNGLQFAGPPLAWYHTEQAPYVMEAGIHVDKRPSGVQPPIELKDIGQAKAIVAHFWGPYELTPKGYEKIKEWLKKNNKKAVGAPFDKYITDPTTVKDPYQVQTDIVQIYQ